MDREVIDVGSSAHIAHKDAWFVCNLGSSSDFNSCRIGIESRISTKDPVLAMYANSGTDSTALRGVIYWNSALNWIIGSDTNVMT